MVLAARIVHRGRMALPSTRVEYKLALSNVDRGVEIETSLILARHPSESMEHATLRVLAWCLLYEDRLALGPGLADAEGADLWTHDLTGRLTTWVECGNAPWEKVRRAAQHHPGAAVHAVFSDLRRRDELTNEAQSSGRAAKVSDAVTVWTIDAALVAALARKDDRRHRWSVTVVGDHFYVEADGETLDGEVARTSLG